MTLEEAIVIARRPDGFQRLHVLALTVLADKLAETAQKLEGTERRARIAEEAYRRVVNHGEGA